MRKILLDILFGVILGLLFMCFVIIFSGCKTQVRVVESVRVDSTKVVQFQHDSIYVHDSVFVMQKGDTIRVTQWHTRYIEKLKRDTIRIIKKVQVPIPYETIKEVPYIPKFYKASTVALWIFIAALCAFVLIKIFLAIYVRK